MGWVCGSVMDGGTVTAELQARRLPPTNGGRPDDDPAFLYIYTYPVTSCWLLEQCSKFNPHPYVHSVRPEFGDRDIARSISPNSLYSDSIPMVTGSPLTLHCSQPLGPAIFFYSPLLPPYCQKFIYYVGSQVIHITTYHI